MKDELMKIFFETTRVYKNTHKNAKKYIKVNHENHSKELLQVLLINLIFYLLLIYYCT